MPETSAASGCAAAGATICQSVPDFCSRVCSPDSDLIAISSILSASTVKTLSFFGPSSPAGRWRVAVHVPAERDRDDEQNDRTTEVRASIASATRSARRASRIRPGMIEDRQPEDARAADRPSA